MFHSLSSKRGITLIEVSIALFLLGFAVLALISLQPAAWRLSGKSDYLGRASAVLIAQLQATEAQIMNANNTFPPGTTAFPASTVYPGGQSMPKQGDVPLTVLTTINGPTATGQTGIWRVTVQVTWPGSAAGIHESLNVAQWEYFRQ
jgi:Tfp pilus assembly protein PilV